MPFPCIAGLVGVKIAGAAPELEMVTDCCPQLLGVSGSPGRRTARGSWGGGGEPGTEGSGIPPPGSFGGKAGQCRRREGKAPVVGVGRRSDMGNAPICQACHSRKGLRTQGNIQDLDKIPDYYGCNGEESKDPEALVSLGRRKRGSKGKIKIRVARVGFEKDLCSA